MILNQFQKIFIFPKKFCPNFEPNRFCPFSVRNDFLVKTAVKRSKPVPYIHCRPIVCCQYYHMSNFRAPVASSIVTRQTMVTIKYSYEKGKQKTKRKRKRK